MASLAFISVLIIQHLSYTKAAALVDSRPDSAFTASSEWNPSSTVCAAYQARWSGTGWCVVQAEVDSGIQQWLQIDLGNNYVIQQISTISTTWENDQEWVESYIVNYKTQNGTWETYPTSGTLPGNTQWNTAKTNNIDIYMVARYLQFEPQTWNTYPSMRVEVYGATKNPTKNPTAIPTDSPTENPTNIPSIGPTVQPTTPTKNPSKTPTETPSQNPTISPSKIPTSVTSDPSKTPTKLPSINPSKYPTKNPAIIPTMFPTNNSSFAPTITTLNPSKLPTLYPSVYPTNDPSKFPTVHSINPSITPTLTPTTAYPTTAMPTCDPTVSCPPTEFPTDAPTAAPTQRPTRSPTNRPTLAPTPTLSPTKYPTMVPTETCSDWQIEIEFEVLRYIQIDNWRNILTNLCLRAFKDTILYLLNEINEWNNEWCVNINIEFEFDLIGNRMLLQDTIDIDIGETFSINNKLYNDFFDDYNKETFIIEYKRILAELIGQNQNDIDIEIASASFEIDDNTPIPTYAPHKLQTKTSGDNKGMLIGVLFAVFGLICCCVTCITCRLFYKYEVKHGGNANIKQMTYEQFHSNPTTPDNNNIGGTFPSSIEMEGRSTSKNVNKKKETDQLEMMNGENGSSQVIEEIIDHEKKQSAFTMSLGDNAFATNMIMDDIINDIASGNEGNDTDEDILDVDMQNYVLTPQ